MDRAFKIFDRSGSGKVSLDEYTETLSQLVGNNSDGAIHFLFSIYDENGDGRLDEAELREALRASMEESGMGFDAAELDDLTGALWEDAGMTSGGGGSMALEDLRAQLERHPGLADELADSITRWCSPPEKARRGKKEKVRSKGMNLHNYWVANRSFLVFVLFFGGLNVALFAYRAFVFSDFKNWDGSGPNVLVRLAVFDKLDRSTANPA